MKMENVLQHAQQVPLDWVWDHKDFCSRTWIPFAITTSEKCAEDLPYGSDVISTAENRVFFDRKQGLRAFVLYQRFYVDDVLQFQSLWKFNSIATLEERMSRASINGEALRWREY